MTEPPKINHHGDIANALNDTPAPALPLDIRELLMRGQFDSAVAELMALNHCDEDSAKGQINAYREALRDRKIALDIQLMNEENQKTGRDQQALLIKWGVRIFCAIVLLLLVYLTVFATQS